ncbi:MAG TPA: hypothetical protein VH761_06270 [Ilumatobacteraceae bacterium]
MNRVTQGAGSAAHFDPSVGTELVGARRRLIMRTGIAGAVAATLLLASCSSDSKGSTAAAATTPTTAAAAPAPTTEAPTSTEAPASESPEAERVASVRPTLDPLIAALAAGDKAASEAALEAYDAGWNGIEVYVNMRSLAMYLKLEADLQVGIEDGLAEDAPDFPALKAMAEELAARYDDAIKLSEAGNPPLHPLVDDVTTLRMIRADLRITTAALEAGDVAKAKEHYAKFMEGFESTAETMLGQRNLDNEVATEEAADAAAAAFEAGTASAEELSDLVAKVTSTYNFGVSLWNAAARNADSAKTEVTDNDLLHLGLIYDLRVQLTKSMKAWTAGDFEYAGSVAATAQTTVFNRVQPYLAAKGADVALKSAIDAYVELAGAAGDAKEVGDANTAAVRATLVAEQALLGQFWSDPAVQEYLAGLPAMDPLT